MRSVILNPHPSYSPQTVFQIRYESPHAGESTTCMVRRLARIFGVPEAEIRWLIAVDDDGLDVFGRAIA